MTGSADTQPTPSPSDSYSPQLRTALILTGVGAAGAYHAGVLRALHEAGVKIDIIAARGVGVVGALFAAIDGAQSLWKEGGFWRSRSVASLYGWRSNLRFAVLAAAVALVIAVAPIAVIAIGAIVFPIDFAARMIGMGGAAGIVGPYLTLTQQAFAPEGLPTWLPRIVVVVLGCAAAALAVPAVRARRRRQRGGLVWRAIGAPIDSEGAIEQCWRVLWELLRGATQLKQPSRTELARRYAEMLVENSGQPGFRELLIAVHDLDAHRDLVFALVDEPRRRDLVRRPTTSEADARRAEVFDLAGSARAHLADAVGAALSLPIATEPYPITFEPDSYWRGETHRLCDRPGTLVRLLEELASMGVDQGVLVSAAPEIDGPHALAAGRADGRGRIGEYLQSAEAAAVRDVTRLGANRPGRLFIIRPSHNPIGPLDLAGGFDDRSDRRQPLSELMSRGYEDAYHQFVEPIVGGSGEGVGVEG